MITITGLSKNYGPTQVLTDVHISMEKGKAYGIVGENGAGKTTFFNCLAGLEKYQGEIKSSYDQLKDKIGYLPTEPFFFPRITGEEYLRLMSQARGIKELDLEQKNIFELPLAQYAENYSTGMKKKLALLAIFLQNNEVFILDEPFNGVDVQSNLLITEVILQLKALGKIVIIASHIFSTLKDTCDEIHVLEGGSFQKGVLQQDFADLEQKMKHIIIGNRIEKLNLR
jgi:ABC-2 type transport system ATP-binding protein